MSRGPWFTAAFKTEVWRRWQAGDNCAEIARALGTYPGPLHRLLSQRGGVAHLRYRSARALSLSEREEISRGDLCWRFHPGDGAADGACPVEHQSRDRPARRPRPLSSLGC